MFFLKELPSQEMIRSYGHLIGPDGETAVAEALTMMRDASLLVRSIERYLAAAKLSQLQFLILMVIHREPERDYLYHGEIAARLDVSKPVLTRAIQTLLQSDLLQATQDGEDRRAKRLRLGPAGEAVLLAQLPGYYALIREFMAAREVKPGTRQP